MTAGRHSVYGVDFSGARDAGEKIWIASGVIEADTLRIDACQQAGNLPRSGKSHGGKDVRGTGHPGCIDRYGNCRE